MTPTPSDPSSSSDPFTPRLEAGHGSFRMTGEAEAFVRRFLERDEVLSGRVETDRHGMAVVLTVAHEYLFGVSYGENPPVELVYRAALG